MWKVSLAGDVEGIADKVLDRISGKPDELILGHQTIAVPDNWRSRLGEAQKRWAVTWKSSGWLVRREPALVTVHVPERPAIGTATTLLAELPFELAAFATLHPWVEDGKPYLAPTFSDGHFRHGWACAFRGAGHARLVSRRWLDYGPWVVEHGDDLSFVLFHDPSADATTALAQAKPGHARMGISDEGGFIQSDYVYKHELKGYYVPAQRQLRIVASRRDVSQREMRDAVAALREQRWGDPVDTVAFAFLEEDRARRHLDLLWLHELQCLAMIEGNEVRLDADYAPARPAPCAWAVQLRS